MNPMLYFEVLDVEFDPAISVAKGEIGTFYIQTNTPNGRSVTTIRFHPQVAERLRDWLVANYPVQVEG